MAKTKISEYDASAGNNTDVNNVNIAEGCAPSGINNAIREVMAALKRFETGADGDSVTVGGNLVVSGGTTANTISASVVSASGNATVGGTLVVTGAATFSNNVVLSGTTSANTISASVMQSDTISEKTSAAGVTVDGVLLKDNSVTANTVKASGTSSTTGEIQLFEDTDNGTNYVALKAPASIASDVSFTLPNADGTSGQALVTNGSGVLSWATAGGYAGISGEVFTSNGTFTVPAGITKVKVTVIGGGGGGGRGTDGLSSGGGGGGGGTAIEWITGLTPGGTVSVTVGSGGAAQTNGGTSSFGSYCSATGGVAGTSSTGLGTGGLAGSGSGGTINITGGNGSTSRSSDQFGGSGGGSLGFGVYSSLGFFGFDGNTANTQSGSLPGVGILGGRGGVGIYGTTTHPFRNATGYGNGGGGNSNDTGTIGTGSAGIVIVEY